MASGVKVHDECVTEFEHLKLRKKYRYITFIIDSDGTVQVCKRGPRDTTYEDFLAEMADVKDQKDCCYSVFDMEFETKGKEKRTKIAFIPWCPDTSNVKRKMLYASSKDAIKKKLDGIKEVQANDMSDLEIENVVSTLDK